MVQPFHPRPAGRSRAAAGFTLAEMMVTLAIFSIVIVAMLAIFDINGRIARVEGHVTDMQQSLRIAQSDMIRLLRMAARGGLPTALFPDAVTAYPGKFLPAGVGIEVANNVPANTTVAGNAAAPVLEGTDVLTVRGVFTTIYQTNAAGSGLTLNDVDNDGYPESGRLVVSRISPTGVPQDLQSLADAITASQTGNPEAFLMASPLDDLIYTVVEIDPSSSFVTSGGVIVQANVNFNASGTVRSNLYAQLSPGGRFPRDMTTVAYVGVLEEYRYYIRDPKPLNAANVSTLEPALTRARLYPGTTIPYANNASNLREEIADNVFDLQVALGIDVDGNSAIAEGTDTTTRKADEWLFNESGDVTTAATWNGTLITPTRIFFVRLNTLARTARRDSQTQWQAPSLGRVEDKDYTQSPFNLFNTAAERKFRRQSLQTLVDLRNLS
jgi:prepilin-type N-terminal cleavage/methylation domain-containing protein